VSGSGVAATEWHFAGSRWDESGSINVTGPTTGNVWGGIAVASGTVTAKVSIDGTPRAEPLTTPLTVSNRGWKWIKANHWSYARTAQDCESKPYQYHTGALLGWTVQKGGCSPSMLTPNPFAPPYGGYALQSAPSGPNEGLWYVSAVSYRMDTESNINSSMKVGGAPIYTLTNSDDKTACKKAKLTAANFYDFSTACKKVNLTPFFDGIWNHEGYGPNNNLAGHQAHLELAALFPQGDPYLSLERVFDTNFVGADLAAINTAQDVNLFLNDQAANESGVNGGFCGDTWQWKTTTNQFLLEAALGTGGRCF
jgi:hypothetical protein